ASGGVADRQSRLRRSRACLRPRFTSPAMPPPTIAGLFEAAIHVSGDASSDDRGLPRACRYLIERLVLIDTDIGRQAKHALCDDVAKDFVRPAGDTRAGRRQKPGLEHRECL